MRRCVAWAVTLVAGVLCLYPGLRMLWSGPGETGKIIQPGTAISVRLLRPITSANAEPGQPFAGYVVSSETVKGSAPVRPGTLVEGTCLVVRKATDNSRPGYVRLALQGLRDSDGRFAPLETTTFSQWGGPEQGNLHAVSNGKKIGDRLALPVEAKTPSNQLFAAVEALLPTEETIKFVVLKPSLTPPGFCVP
ncbi:MAG: hypothetical protein ACLQVM_01240 [Terriglobia bacterium]